MVLRYSCEINELVNMAILVPIIVIINRNHINSVLVFKQLIRYWPAHEDNYLYVDISLLFTHLECEHGVSLTIIAL